MKELPTITAADLILFGPCYRGSQLHDLVEFAESRSCWNALEILDCEQYPIHDRCWLIFRRDLLPEDLIHEITCRFLEYCVETAIASGNKFAPIMQEVLNTKRAWLRNESTTSALADLRYRLYNLMTTDNSESALLLGGIRWASSYDIFRIRQDAIHAFVTDELRAVTVKIIRDAINEELAK